jgi:hypothetical protein
LEDRPGWKTFPANVPPRSRRPKLFVPDDGRRRYGPLDVL